MTENKPGVALYSLKVGLGNPASVIALASQAKRLGLSAQTNLIDNLTARTIHTRISQTPERIANYTDNGESLRSGFAATVFASIFLPADILISNIRASRNIFDIGVFAQELLLDSFGDAQLMKKFPKGVFLLIPNVHANDNAKEVLKRKKARPVVWNKDEYKVLRDTGYDPVLVAPWLPSGFIETEEMKDPTKNRIVVKASGGGIPKQFLNPIRQLKESGKTIREFLPDGRDPDLQMSEFYNDLINNPPETLIGFSSENIQVVSYLYSKSWKGRFLSLPPKGDHELKNLEWAVKMGICQGVIDFGFEMASKIMEIPGIRIIKPEDIPGLPKTNFDLNQIKEQLGKGVLFEKI
jgi:hypothetical protein